MTCGAADLVNLEDHRVLIAIDKDFFDDLCIAGLLAFFPEFVSGTGPVGGNTALEGFIPGFFIDVCKHEHIARLIVLRDSGNQSPALFEIQIQHWIILLMFLI